MIGRDIVLKKDSQGERMPTELWSANRTVAATGASFVRFDKFFSTKLKALLVENCPSITTLFFNLLRNLEYPIGLLLCQNWADIFPYLFSTIFKVYGFQGSPHVFPYHVPLKVGVAEFFWLLGMLED